MDGTNGDVAVDQYHLYEVTQNSEPPRVVLLLSEMIIIIHGFENSFFLCLIGKFPVYI